MCDYPATCNVTQSIQVHTHTHTHTGSPEHLHFTSPPQKKLNKLNILGEKGFFRRKISFKLKTQSYALTFILDVTKYKKYLNLKSLLTNHERDTYLRELHRFVEFRCIENHFLEWMNSCSI